MASDDEPEHPAPTIEAIHANIGFANQFRLELIKLILTLSPALLAFTLAFRPKIKDPQLLYLMWMGWIALGLATVGAMVNMYGWERYYASHRDYKANIPAGERARKVITAWRRGGVLFQFGGFAGGVLALAVFAAANLDRVVAGTP